MTYDTNSKIRRGDVYWIELESNVHCLSRGIRPAVVISNNVNNKYSNIVYVVPFTSREKKPQPTHFTTFINGRRNTILGENIMPIEKDSIKEENFMFHCDDELMVHIERIVKNELGMD